jgi:hypothetical protein
MKQYTGRPEKYEELAHTPRDAGRIAPVPGFKQLVSMYFARDLMPQPDKPSKKDTKSQSTVARAMKCCGRTPHT